MRKPELLSPAGTVRNMRYAFAYGADAVYAGMPRYSLRVRNNDFLEDNLRLGIKEAHDLGKQFFVATNVMPHGAKLKTFLDDIKPVVEMQPDALIMADPGLIMLVREHWPDMPVHLSVQANTVNAAGVKFWQSVGLTRVILSRELSLDEVADIRQACPDIELEVFVHGALCIAYSGRCLLSGYFNHRDANQGTCTNACRWDYKVSEEKLSEEKVGHNKQLDNKVYYFEEQGRPGEYMPVEEDEHGTYVMNSKDLRAVEHVQRLVEIGIDCLKIEGRTKSHYYTSRTAQVYRWAIDAAAAGQPFDPAWMGELESLANRGYTDGFFERHETQALQNYREGASRTERAQFVAEVSGVNEQNRTASLVAKNKFSIGDEVEFLTPQGNYRFQLTSMVDKHGKPVESALGSGWEVEIPLPEDLSTDALSMGLLTRLTE